jgi:hypothetical protein
MALMKDESEWTDAGDQTKQICFTHSKLEKISHFWAILTQQTLWRILDLEDFVRPKPGTESSLSSTLLIY